MTLGVDSEFTGYTLALYQLLAEAGVPREACTWRREGGTASRVKALMEGRIAATMVSVPQTIAPEAAGFKAIADVRDIGLYQTLCGCARRAWADSNGRVLEAFIRAYVDANDWLLDPRNTAEAADIYKSRIAGVTRAVAEKA